MMPRSGRAPRGQRVVGTAPRNHGKNTTLIAAAGYQVLWLPPDSRDFSPIEAALSTLKTALRRAEARTREAWGEAITAPLATITVTDTPIWFAHCDYRNPAHLL